MPHCPLRLASSSIIPSQTAHLPLPLHHQSNADPTASSSRRSAWKATCQAIPMYYSMPYLTNSSSVLDRHHYSYSPRVQILRDLTYWHNSPNSVPSIAISVNPRGPYSMVVHPLSHDMQSRRQQYVQVMTSTVSLAYSTLVSSLMPVVQVDDTVVQPYP